MERDELLAAVRGLRTYGPPDRPARHQAILLLWSLGRARRGLPRLARWSTAQPELQRLLAVYGRPENGRTPEFPFVALARTTLWEVDRPNVPAAHGSQVLTWLNSNDPQGGLSQHAHDLLISDLTLGDEVVEELLTRYFAGDSADGLLKEVGLSTSIGEWDLRPGEVLRRRVLHERFGGQTQGGISTPADSKRVFLFSGSTGSLYGYTDGWQPDGSYHYTGQGRVGDQTFTAANRSVIDPGREVHIFEGETRTTVRYIGQFRPDDHEPYYRTDAPDTTSEIRSVLVFRLWPVDSGTPPTASPSDDDGPIVSEIPLEAHNVASFAANPATGPTDVERREAALVQRYSAWLAAQGISTVRNKIRIAGRPLLTDVFTQQTKELVEAKGSARRDSVRLALGQILDYARYVKPNSLAVLLPVLPPEDMVTLLADYGVHCVYETDPGKFERA